MNKTPKLRFKEFSGEWDVKKLEELTNYVDYRGKTPTKSESGIFLVTAKNIKKGYIDYAASQEFISKESHDEAMRRGLPKKGDVLLTTEAPLGNVAQIDREDVALAQRVIKFRGTDELNNTYLKYYFLSERFQNKLFSKAIGTTVLGIQGKVLHKMPVTFPSKEEQEKIASFISLIDDKISLQGDKVEALKDYKKGMMQKIFSRELRFKDDEGRDYPAWEHKKLCEVVDVIDGDRGINYPKENDFFDSGYCLFLNAKNVTKNGFDFIDTKFITKERDNLLKKGKLEREDVILTTRGTVGNIAYFDNSIEYNYIRINSGMVILRSKYILSKYLYKFMDSKYLRKQMDQVAFGSAQPQLTVKGINNFKIIVPCYDEQKKISNLLCNLDYKLIKEKEKLDYLNEYKKGLLQQMFI